MGLHAYGSDGWAKCGNDWITTSNPNARAGATEPQRPQDKDGAALTDALYCFKNFMPHPFSYSESIPNPIPNPISVTYSETPKT